MIAALFLILLAVPLVELYVIVQVAGGIGIIPTLALLIGMSIAGAWLLKQQGVAVWRKLQAASARGEIPAKEVVDGALILFGGALLLTPGFVTDIVGLALLLPPSRAVVRRAGGGFLKGLATSRLGAVGRAGTVGKRVYDARVTRIDRNRSPGRTTTSSRPPLSAGERDPGDGSLDKG